MKRRFNRKGFSMAEVLIVLAILAVLAGVGVVALFSHMRSMQQLEMDGKAKEIFIAAQNHLAMAESQGYLGKTYFGEDTHTVNDDNVDLGVYYFIVNGVSDLSRKESVLGEMLPMAAVDENARIGGSYIIRYQKSPGLILDVFYSEPEQDGASNRYCHTMVEEDYGVLMSSEYYGAENKSKRRNYGDDKAVIGWYGGETEQDIPVGTELRVPYVEIINEETLTVKVVDYNADTNLDSDGATTNYLRLYIEGETSGAKSRVWDLYSLTPNGNTYTIMLDDVSANGEHFANIPLAEGGSGFQPGEFITAVVEAGNNSLFIAPVRAEDMGNSLFGDNTGLNETEGKYILEINNFRHLMNLDDTISNFAYASIWNSSCEARQTMDLDWGSFLGSLGTVGVSTYKSGSTANIASSTAGSCFLPMQPTYRLYYNGQGHSITGLKVDTSKITSNSTRNITDAGLFSALGNSFVTNLVLVDADIASTGGSAGALAGTMNGASISGVLVRNSLLDPEEAEKSRDASSLSITGATAAGGLVGGATNGIIELSAAAVYVQATGGSAGGLVGTANGTTLRTSYSGGHTIETKYQDNTTGVGDNHAGRLNVVATASAGGLVGTVSGVTINSCYSTASAYGAAPGGLIGTSTSGSVTNCYSTGLVQPINAAAMVNPFIGEGVTATTLNGNYYLLGIITASVSNTTVSGITPMAAGDTASGIVLTEGNGAAMPYDTKLSLKYAFKTIEQLSGTTTPYEFNKVHYGDWQLPSLTPLDYILVNENTLYTQIKLESTTSLVTLALEGEASGNVRLFVLEVSRGADKKVTGVTVKSETWSSATDGKADKKPATLTDLLNSSNYGLSNVSADGTATLTINLDDITSSNGHFAQLFANDSADHAYNLLPGENVTLYVRGGEGMWSEVETLETEEEEAGDAVGDFNPYSKTDNSLFGKKSVFSASAKTMGASIVNIRHLQNLDISVSWVNQAHNDDANIAAVTSAKLENDITWDAKWMDPDSSNKTTVTTISNGSCEAGKFNGIYCPYLTEFAGQNKTISNLDIGAAQGKSTNGAGNAGLFRLVSSGTLKIEKLRLTSPTVSTSAGYAGAVVAEVRNSGNVEIDTVLVADKTDTVPAAGETGAVEGSLNAGGLVGLKAGTGELKINNSAASIYIKSAGAAGGLLGEQAAAGGKITFTNSYVGGHTVNKKYYTGGAADGGTDGRWNIISTGGAAGGLIGAIAGGATADISQTFSAASVYSANSGGLVGSVAGSLSLSTVYTVAPVNNVKLYKYDKDNLKVDFTTVEREGNGAVIGSYSTAPSISDVFYLADIYKEAKFNNGATETNIGAVSSGTLTGIKLASYYGDKDDSGHYVGDSAHIIGLANNDTLEFETTAYDPALKIEGEKKEFPFSIWTNFDFDSNSSSAAGKPHFYGDWEPVESEKSELFKFYFLREDPENDKGEGAPIISFGPMTGYYQLAVQLKPFTGADLPIPTIPYIPGYAIGSGSGSEESLIYWTVYYGDQRSVLMAGGTPEGGVKYTYSAEGGTVEVEEPLLLDVNNSTYQKTMTFLAHYYNPGNQYIVRLMDYKPDAASIQYENYGALQVVQPSTPGGSVAVSSAYPSELFIPRRTYSGYHFLGWYTAPEGESGTCVFGLNSAGEIVPSSTYEIGGNVTLYARYKAKEEASVTVKFVVKDGENEYPLDAVYQVKFDKSFGLDHKITLPGDVKGYRVTKTMTAGGTPENVATGPDQEAEFIPKTDNVNQDKYVRLTTGVQASYPVEYTVYVEGAVDTVYYAVVHVLKNANSDLSYNATSDYTYRIDYIATLTNTYPTLGTGSILTGLAGYSEDPAVQDVAAPSANFTELKNKYNVEGTHSGKEVKYIFELTYERDQHWLVFTNTGDSYYPPEMVYAGQPLSTYLAGIEEPSYHGYRFQGWVVGTDEAAVPDVMPNDDLTVRAKWKGEQVEYTVLVWLENAEDEGYTLAGDLKLQAYAGDRLHVNGKDDYFIVTAGDGSPRTVGTSEYEKLAEIRDYIHYSDSDTGVEVKGNGGTVLNVYYDRNIYTLRFDIGFGQAAGDWNYTAKTQEQALASHEQVYGLVGGSYIPLKYVNGQWTYSGTFNRQIDYAGTRYKEENTNEAKYGIVNDAVVELTGSVSYVFNWQYYRNWRWRDAGSGDKLYTKSGNSYPDSGLTTGSAFASDAGYASGTYYIINQSEYRNARTDGVKETRNQWSYNGNPYNGTRYRAGTDHTYNHGFVDGEMITLQREGERWYYTVEETTEGVYNASDGLYLATHNDVTFYVSNVTNTTTDGGYGGFFTNKTVNVGKTMPFDLGDFNGTYLDGHRKVYYKDVTAKYGARIYDEWPDYFKDQRSGNTTYSFIGWITSADAWYWRGDGAPHSSIKGKVEMMSEEVIKVWDGRQYSTTPVTIGNGIANEFHCRYNNGVRKYVYQQYFWNPVTGDYDLKQEDIINGGSGSTPEGQTDLSYMGYERESKEVKINNRWVDARNQTGYNPYDVTLRSGETIRAMAMRYKFKPHDGSLTFLIGENNTVVRQVNTVYYGQDLASYIPASITVPDGYTFMDEWYDNEQCEGEPFFKVNDAEYNSSRKMPDGDVRLYARLVHNPVTVSFSLEGVNYSDGTAVTAAALPEGMSSSYTVKYEATLHEEANLVDDSTLDIFDADGEVLATFRPESSADGYSFKYWCYRDGETYRRFSYAHLLETNLTLYPMFDNEDVAAERPITINYQLLYYDADGNEVVGTAAESVQAAFRDASGNILTAEAEGSMKIKDGDRVTYRAPEISGYSIIDVSKTIYRVSEANHEITIRYRDNSWKYNVEYYVQYSNLENPADWTSGHYDSGAAAATIKIAEAKNVPAGSQYVLLGYTQPDTTQLLSNAAGMDLTKYRFDHFEYEDEPCYDNYITINPEAGNLVKVYLVPDNEAIEVADIVLYYDGTSKTNYQPSTQPLNGPSEATIKVGYLYYKPVEDGVRYTLITDPSEVTHAGTYGVRAYITAKVGGKTYLVWQSEGSTSVPPLHLYIQRRTVVMVSKSDSKSESELGGGYLTRNQQTDVDDTATSISIGGETIDTGDMQFGFVSGEGAIYTFSANAFRRMPGTSSNVFTYKVKDNTRESDYNFFIFYGTLTVTGSGA